MVALLVHSSNHSHSLVAMIPMVESKYHCVVREYFFSQNNCLLFIVVEATVVTKVVKEIITITMVKVAITMTMAKVAITMAMIVALLKKIMENHIRK